MPENNAHPTREDCVEAEEWLDNEIEATTKEDTHIQRVRCPVCNREFELVYERCGVYAPTDDTYVDVDEALLTPSDRHDPYYSGGMYHVPQALVVDEFPGPVEVVEEAAPAVVFDLASLVDPTDDTTLRDFR